MNEKVQQKLDNLINEYAANGLYKTTNLLCMIYEENGEIEVYSEEYEKSAIRIKIEMIEDADASGVEYICFLNLRKDLTYTIMYNPKFI